MWKIFNRTHQIFPHTRHRFWTGCRRNPPASTKWAAYLHAVSCTVAVFTRWFSNNQSINKSRHSTEARATVRLCRIKEICLETDLKCVNRWSSSTVQWKRVPESRSINWETTSSSVQVVWRNWQKVLCGWSQQARLTVWADQISEVAWLSERSNQVTKFGEFEVDPLPDWQPVQAP